MKTLVVKVASDGDLIFAEEVCKMIEASAKKRGTGIAIRSPQYIKEKINEGKAIIALRGETLLGFCYIESWSNKEYVANSGLIVHPEYRGSGLAKKIKKVAFEHSRKLFPDAKLFGLTTSLPVMKINSELGYIPVTYNQLTRDETFWKGCQSCVNYEILNLKNRDNCMCTAMIFDPVKKNKKKWNFLRKSKIYGRFMKLKSLKLRKEA